MVSALERSITRPLTLVRAPTGYGKTAALHELQDVADVPVAWLTPARGNTPLWMQVVDALRSVVPALAAEAAAPPARPGDGLGGVDPGDHVVDRLHEAAARLPGTTVLVVDDVDLALDAANTHHTARFVERLPPVLRLVLVTRRDLHLPTGRWRTQGRVAEIGPDELRFTPDDTRALLGELGRSDLTADAVAALTDRAEGWPAGVRLLVASLPAGVTPTAADVARMPLDPTGARSLIDRTLGIQEPEVQAFLLTTSVLGRFSADLCRAVTERPDAGRILRDVDEEGLFVVPLDDDKTWFRYQRLFVELLRTELDHRHPAAARSLRRTAAGWFASRRDASGAVHQLSAAGDLGEAFSMVSTDPYDAGWGRLIGTDWSSVFPEGWVEDDPARMLHFAALLGRSGRLDEATAWLARAEAALADRPADDPQRAVLVATQALWSGITFHAREAEERGTRALDTPLPPGAESFHERVRVVLCAVRVLLDDVDGAESLVAELDVAQSSEIMRGLMVPAMRARIALRRGHLRDAEAIARRALHTAEAMALPGHPGLRDAQIALAGVTLEHGDLDQAARLVEQAAAMADSLGWPAFAAAYRAELAHVQAARYGPQRGIALLDDVRGSLRDQPVGAELHAVLDGHEARLRLAAGEVDEAEVLIARMRPGWQRDLAAIQAALVGGDRERAGELLAAFSPPTLRYLVVRDLYRARLADAEGDRDGRDRHLLAAARIGLAQGFAKVFLTEAAELVPALRDLARRHHELQPLVDDVARVAGRRDRVRSADLSEREVAVLRYLPGTMTHLEIAGDLGVSTNTVKSHVRSLYRKLGVQSRPDAVDAARRQALL